MPTDGKGELAKESKKPDPRVLSVSSRWEGQMGKDSDDQKEEEEKKPSLTCSLQHVIYLSAGDGAPSPRWVCPVRYQILDSLTGLIMPPLPSNYPRIAPSGTGGPVRSA